VRELVVLGTASQVPTRARGHNGCLLRWDTDRCSWPGWARPTWPAFYETAELREWPVAGDGAGTACRTRHRGSGGGPAARVAAESGVRR